MRVRPLVCAAHVSIEPWLRGVVNCVYCLRIYRAMVHGGQSTVAEYRPELERKNPAKVKRPRGA